MTTHDKDPTGEKGKPNEETATGKRKEPPHHDDEAACAHASPDVGKDYDTPDFMEISRSEKKREREKKRRSDLNQGLDQLMALIFMIDPQLKAKAEAEEWHRKSHHNRISSREEPEIILSRVELINAAIATLQRVHRENEENKMLISFLTSGLHAQDGGNGGPLQPAFPPSFASAAAYPHHAARPPDIQHHLRLQQQLNAAALAAPVAGNDLRQPLQNDASVLLQEYLASQRSRQAPVPSGASDASVLLQEYLASQASRQAPVPSGALGARQPNSLSLEAILGGFQSATAPLGPHSSQLDTMALLRAMEQDRFRGNAAANDLSSILGQSAAPTANNPRNILGQSAAAVPVLPHSAEIEALLQQMRRKESNRQTSNRNFYGS